MKKSNLVKFASDERFVPKKAINDIFGYFGCCSIVFLLYSVTRQTQSDKPTKHPKIAWWKFLEPGKFLRWNVKSVIEIWKLFSKVFGHSGKFLETLESFGTLWKVSRYCGKLMDTTRSFRTLWNVDGPSGKFWNTLESFWPLWKVCGHWKVSGPFG